MLMLRKACQPLLNEIGLNSMHIEYSNGFLILVGECGQRITTIRGITLRRTINKDERIYTVELFKDFLVKNKTRLLAYSKARKDLNNAQPPIHPDNKTYDSALLRITLKQGVILTVFEKGAIIINGAFSIKEFPLLIKPHKKEIAVKHAFLVELAAYRKLQRNLEKHKQDLNTCSI